MKNLLTIISIVTVGSLIMGTTAMADVTVQNSSAYAVNYNINVNPNETATVANTNYTVFTTNDGQTQQMAMGLYKSILYNSGALNGTLAAGQALVISETGMTKSSNPKANELQLTMNVPGDVNAFTTGLYNYGTLSAVPVTQTNSQILMVASSGYNKITLTGGTK
ncbi:MAG: hypothetical protein NTX05_02165 [Fusobacteria bacterium]|nr:hypothetical protein [Fusobacteriota bacterium]